MSDFGSRRDVQIVLVSLDCRALDGGVDFGRRVYEQTKVEKRLTTRLIKLKCL